MRIPTGNFGNVTPQPQPTRVNVDGVGAPAQAVAKLSDDVRQQVNAVVRGRAGDELLDYQIKIKDINEAIRTGVEDGSLRADQVETFYQTAVGKLDKPQFAGLDIAGSEVAQRGVTRYESDGMSTARNYAHTALKIEARDQVDGQLDQLGKLTNYPDADIEKINASMDALNEQGRIAYGAQWGKVKQTAIDKNWYNQAQQRLMQARNNGGALTALNNDLTAENGFYLDKLDPEKRNALLNQSMNYQITIENRARAAEAKRESQAAKSLNEFSLLVDNNFEPSEEAVTTLLSSTRGTSLAGEAQKLLSDQIEIRKAISDGPAAAQALILDQRKKLEESGGDLNQWRSLQRRTTAVAKAEKEWEAAQGRVMVSNALNNGVALDPDNKNNKDAAGNYWRSEFKDFNINDNEQINAAASFVTKTGIIPPELSSILNAASVSKDPKVAIPAAELVSRIYDSNPAALSNMPKEKQSFYLNAKLLRDAGVNPDMAMEQSYNLAYNQSDALKSQLASEQGTSSYKKDRLNAASDFVSKRSEFLRRDPSAKDTTPEATRFRNDYQSLYDINFRTAGGNADVAKKMTEQQIARAWSISEVNGSAQLMKYAPEALYQGGPSGWQSKQWEEERKALIYGTSEVPAVTAAGGSLGRVATANVATPERKVKGDVILVPDVSTPRNGDYAIMISDKDKDGVPTLQPYFDADGRPLRYRPDLQSWKPYQELLTDQKASVEQTMQKAQERRGFYDAHRGFDDQYQEGHEKRIEKQKTQLKNYFRWGNE
ncbi:hypothetical protein KGP26_10600 [Serratia sp. JSRIV002]|uniref:hypothetical protein n=1 Tax=Serratia sp. JSRIV002 TaxID=2831894 RepID=UPI001CBFF340|nr:hypothetical protein [Serratia sp. JSRIV002]UAN54458.1 hypothetical protein KGP26_10600 [Serratia sp. JSRIV002]